MRVVLLTTPRGPSTSNRLTSRTCHGSANSRITVSRARAAERCPPPALKYTRSMDFIVSVILRTENDRTMNLARPALDSLHRGYLNESFARLSTPLAAGREPPVAGREPPIPRERAAGREGVAGQRGAGLPRVPAAT